MVWLEPIVLVLQSLQSLSWEIFLDHISTVRFAEIQICVCPLPVMISFRGNSYAPRVRNQSVFHSSPVLWVIRGPGLHRGIQHRHSQVCCYSENIALWMYEEKKKKNISKIIPLHLWGWDRNVAYGYSIISSYRRFAKVEKDKMKV